MSYIPENIFHHFSDGLYAKEIKINAGDHLLQHKHGEQNANGQPLCKTRRPVLGSR